MQILDFTQAEIDAVEDNLLSSDRMLEYGCGGSSLHFSSFVREYYSIEHNYGWYQQVRDSIYDQGINNVRLDLVIPIMDDLALSGYDHPDLNGPEGLRIFNNYINHCHVIDKPFDKVLMDGRARKHCANEIHKYLRPNGLLLFHDFNNRPYYHEILDKYEICDKVDTLAILKKK